MEKSVSQIARLFPILGKIRKSLAFFQIYPLAFQGILS
jgi:hypothetical protein